MTGERESGRFTVEISGRCGDDRLPASLSSLEPMDHEFCIVSQGGTRDPIEFDLND